jgi:hypothetical protein
MDNKKNFVYAFDVGIKNLGISLLTHSADRKLVVDGCRIPIECRVEYLELADIGYYGGKKEKRKHVLLNLIDCLGRLPVPDGDFGSLSVSIENQHSLPMLCSLASCIAAYFYMRGVPRESVRFTSGRLKFRFSKFGLLPPMKQKNSQRAYRDNKEYVIFVVGYLLKRGCLSFGRECDRLLWETSKKRDDLADSMVLGFLHLMGSAKPLN